MKMVYQYLSSREGAGIVPAPNFKGAIMNKVLEIIIAGCALVMVGFLLFAGAVAVGLVSPVYGKCYQTIEGKTCPLVNYKLGGE
jgi:hypothetical protein